MFEVWSITFCLCEVKIRQQKCMRVAECFCMVLWCRLFLSFVVCSQKYKESLGLPQKLVIGYQAHADTATKSNSITKNKFVVWKYVIMWQDVEVIFVYFLFICEMCETVIMMNLSCFDGICLAYQFFLTIKTWTSFANVYWKNALALLVWMLYSVNIDCEPGLFVWRFWISLANEWRKIKCKDYIKPI